MVKILVRVALYLALIGLLTTAFSQVSFAQGSVTILSEVLDAPAATLGNGDDFATTVLGDPWDMNQRRDIGWEENVTNVRIENGVWRATQSPDLVVPSGGSAYVFPLFQGFPNAWPAGKIGANYPIDPDRYRLISYRMYVDDRAGGNHAIQWSHAGPNGEITWPDGSNFFAWSDGLPNGWKLYNLDLVSTPLWRGASRTGDWLGSPICGLRIDPNPASGTKPIDIQFDWIRLTDPTTSPQYVITWDRTAFVPEDDLAIFIDTDASGYDGMQVATVKAGVGTYTLLTSILPGGDYYVYLRAGDVVSNYGQRLRINNPPEVKWDLTAFSDDYASTVLGDSWDMSNLADVPMLDPMFMADPAYYAMRQFFDPVFAGGVFSATADAFWARDVGGYINIAQTDVQMHLNVPADKPIDPARYRYAVLRFKVDDPLDRTISQRVFDGWVGRFIWWNNGIAVDGIETDEFFYYEGWNTYLLDLGLRACNPANVGACIPGMNWVNYGPVLNMRFDPLEVSTNTRFHVDEIRLLSAPSASTALKLYLSARDIDGQNVILRFFLDNDDQGFDGFEVGPPVAIQAAGLTAQTGGYQTYLPLVPKRPTPSLTPIVEPGAAPMQLVTVNVEGVAPGQYYVYVCASDGIADTCHYFPVPVTITR